MVLWAVALAVMTQMLSHVGTGLLLRAIVAVAGQRLSVIRGILIFLAASSIGLVAGGIVGNAAAIYRWVRSQYPGSFTGGVGIVEGTMAIMYSGLGVPDGVTVVVILTYRLLSTAYQCHTKDRP